MKHMFRYLLCVLSIALLSCAEDVVGLDEKDVITVSHDSLNFECYGEDKSIELTSLCDWSSEIFYKDSEGPEDQGWLSLSPSSGGVAQNINILVKATKNLRAKGRKATIRIFNEQNGVYREISVDQDCASITTDTTHISATSEGATMSIALNSNISWTALCDADWVTLSPQSGSKGLSTLEVIINPNTAISDRSTKVIISNSEYNITKEIDVSQTKFEPTISVGYRSISATCDGMTEDVNISSNVWWTASCSADWVTLSPTSGSKGLSILKVTIKPNTADSGRSTKVIISNSEYNITKEIDVLQSKLEPRIIVESSSISATCDGMTEDINISSSVWWTASCSADWVTLSPTSGSNGLSTLKVTIKPNTAASGRSTKVIISNSEYNITKEIDVLQTKFEPRITVESSSISIRYGSRFGFVDIDSNVSWVASCSADWLTLSPINSPGGKTSLMVYISSNLVIANPVTTIYIQNNEYGITETISVSLEISPDELYYTTSNDKVLSFYRIDGFGANVISNKYVGDIGVITFDAPISSIGDEAFYYCQTLTGIAIPDSVTKIGDGAFNRCELLTSMVIPDGVTEIGEWAFASCLTMTSITIPDSVTEIGKEAFCACSSLESINIPDSVTEIGEGAFRGCSGLKSINISKNVQLIKPMLFYGCSSMKSVDIPQGVVLIGYEAFSYCGLRSITIPDSVELIGESTFYSCDKLSSVYCQAIVPPLLYNYAFDACPSDFMIYVPNNSVGAYKQAANWKYYASAIVGFDF